MILPSPDPVDQGRERGVEARTVRPAPYRPVDGLQFRGSFPDTPGAGPSYGAKRHAVPVSWRRTISAIQVGANGEVQFGAVG